MSDQLEQSPISDDDNNLVDSQEMEDLSEEQSKFLISLGWLEIVIQLSLSIYWRIYLETWPLRSRERELINYSNLISCGDNFGLGKPNMGQFGLRGSDPGCIRIFQVIITSLYHLLALTSFKFLPCRDQFYMQFFKSAFPDSDFSQLVETDDEDVMGANIQALIDMLSQKVLMYDLEHIKGDQIVAGNPEHCINLLQLAKEFSCMMKSNSNELGGNQMQGEDDEDEEGDSGVDYENQDDLNEMQQ